MCQVIRIQYGTLAYSRNVEDIGERCFSARLWLVAELRPTGRIGLEFVANPIGLPYRA